VGVGGQDATLVDLSHSGAYIRTPEPGGVGDDVQVEVRLPNDATLQTTATVIHASASGMGVRFQLDPGARTALASAMTSITARRPQALVVDDDSLTLKMVADAFEQSGYDVVTAPDAEFAMHALADQIMTLDLLVTDVLMPGVDGEQLVRRIRGIGGESDLPIIAISGRVDDALAARLRAAGADAVLAKSLGPDSIVRSANEVVVLRRSTPREAATPRPLEAPLGPLP
jgi:CheY-like chemotaxis protein